MNRRKPAFSRAAVSLHESAHVVVTYRLTGRCCYAKVNRKPTADGVRGYAASETKRRNDRVCASLAGLCGALIDGSIDGHRQFGGDAERIHELLVGLSDKEIARVVKRQTVRAVGILRGDWLAVVAIADHLCRRGQITKSEISRFMRTVKTPSGLRPKLSLLEF